MLPLQRESRANFLIKNNVVDAFDKIERISESS